MHFRSRVRNRRVLVGRVLVMSRRVLVMRATISWP
jgi:hypothetical protein